MLNWLANNWFLLVMLVVITTEVVVTLVKFSNKPTEEKIAKFKEWLLLMVAQAEKELGGGTGKLKLRYVYDMFTARFPFAAKILSFEQFSNLVDEALEKFNKILQSNKMVENYVNGTEGEE